MAVSPRILTFFLTLFLFAFLGCSPQHDGQKDSSSSSGYTLNPNPDLLLKAAASDLLGNKCAICHGLIGSDPLFLNTIQNPDIDSLISNGKYVQIGQSNISLLYNRSIDGSMPPGNPLSSTEADVIKDWVNDLGIAPQNDDTEEPPPPSFTSIENDILVPKCYSCHDTQAPTFQSYSDVFSKIVVSGDPDSSPLFNETSIGSMPKNLPSLSTEELTLISEWIQNGALNN